MLITAILTSQAITAWSAGLSSMSPLLTNRFSRWVSWAKGEGADLPAEVRGSLNMGIDTRCMHQFHVHV